MTASGYWVPRFITPLDFGWHTSPFSYAEFSMVQSTLALTVSPYLSGSTMIWVAFFFKLIDGFFVNLVISFTGRANALDETPTKTSALWAFRHHSSFFNLSLSTKSLTCRWNFSGGSLSWFRILRYCRNDIPSIAAASWWFPYSFRRNS